MYHNRGQEPQLIKPEMVPISGINHLFHTVSSARQVMLGGNLSQALIVADRTRKRQQSGLEKELARATFSHKFPRDALIKAIIPRFSTMMHGESFNGNPLEIVIYEDFETKQLDVMELSRFHVMHQHYGFEFNFETDEYDRLSPGEHYKKDTIIANSPAVTADGDYMLGLETNVIQLSHSATTEDGVMYSESYAKRIRSNAFETRTFTAGRSHYPANIYGNNDIYKPIPDLGEEIHTNGLVCALRPYGADLNPIYMSRRQLFKPVYGLDTTLFGQPKGKVIDIKVMHNDTIPNPRMPEEMSRQFRKYYEADVRFYTEIVRTCLFRNGKMSYSVDLSPRLWNLIYEAIAGAGTNLVKEGIWPKDDADRLKVKKNYRGEQLDEWRVDITYQYQTSIGEGQKVTDLHGGKGVGSWVVPDADMPRDKFGNVSEVCVLDSSTVNRQNNGRQHEQMIGAAGRDVIKRIRRSYNLPDMGFVPDEVIRKVVTAKDNARLLMDNFIYLIGFYQIVSPKMYKNLTREHIIPKNIHVRHLIEVIKDGEKPYGLFIQMVADSGLGMADVIEQIRSGPYCPEMSEVTYRAPNGEVVTTVAPVLIGPNYYLILEKSATDLSGVSSAKVNHFGITTRLTNADKYSRPGRETVTRSIDEATARNMAHAMGAEMVADISDMNNNPVVHKEINKNILTHPTPTNMDEAVDREKFKIGGHRPRAFMLHQLACSGKNISRD